MSIISITVTESNLQLIAGIPTFVTLETNIPSTIFYTLDNTEPSSYSNIYSDSIYLPTDQNTITLKLFATNGSDTSSIITQTYGTSTVSNRNARDKVYGLSTTTHGATFPFGDTPRTDGLGIYGNAGGITVDSPDIAGIGDGYDGSGTNTHSSETDLPVSEYDLIFSETDRIGQRGIGIGTLPNSVTVNVPAPLQELSEVSTGSPNTSSPFFNPKALVIFQDTREEQDPDRPILNRQNFDTDDIARTRTGSNLYTTALEGNQAYGTSMVPQYNSRDGTVTFYYRDSATNRWIISKTEYTPKPENNNFSSIVFGRGLQGWTVFKWLPFYYGRIRT